MYVASPGISIHRACCEADEEFRRTGAPVWFTFNGVALCADGLRPEDLADRYWRESEMRRRESPTSDHGAAKRLREMEGDIENRHRAADELLCELLLLHGFTETVAEFRKMRKWHA